MTACLATKLYASQKLAPQRLWGDLGWKSGISGERIHWIGVWQQCSQSPSKWPPTLRGRSGNPAESLPFPKHGATEPGRTSEHAMSLSCAETSIFKCTPVSGIRRSRQCFIEMVHALQRPCAAWEGENQRTHRYSTVKAFHGHIQLPAQLLLTAS